MPVFVTACPRNCYSTCSMRVTVENGCLARIEAHPDNLATPEGVCLKGLSYVERWSSPERLLAPLRRISPGPARSRADFVAISWAEALEWIAAALRQVKAVYGPQAVMCYTGSGTKGWLNRLGSRFWRLFGGYTTTYGDLCWPAGLEAARLTLGENKHNAPWDLANARLIVLWGKNPAETNIHQVRLIDQALAQGGQLIVVDPRRTVSAEKAALHIQPRPGSDGALALGVAHLLLRHHQVDTAFVQQHVLGFAEFAAMLAEYPPERVCGICDIPLAELEALARALGTIEPFTINAGYGMQRYTNGGQTMRAVIALAALRGQVGRSGGGFAYANLQTFVFDRVKDPLDLYPPEQPDGVARIAAAAGRLGSDMLALTRPPLKFLWVERGNPVAQNPGTHQTLQAIRGLDFRVVVDELLTDTALEADIVLPAKTFFEQTDVITAYWHPYLQLCRKVLDSPGEVRPESEIYWTLGETLGYTPDELHAAGLPAPGESETFVRAALNEVNARYGSNLTLEQLALGPALAPGTQIVAFADHVFPTPSGKIELHSAEAARRWGVDPLPRWSPPVESALRLAAGDPPAPYPLQLLTPNTKNTIHSQFHRLRLIAPHDPGPRLTMHPADAAARGIEPGMRVRVFNARGEVFLEAHLDYGIRPGCVACPNGYWLQDGAGVNLLSLGRETDMGHGAAFHDNLVQVAVAR